MKAGEIARQAIENKMYVYNWSLEETNQIHTQVGNQVWSFLAVDIRDNHDSKFIRVNRGLFIHKENHNEASREQLFTAEQDEWPLNLLWKTVEQQESPQEETALNMEIAEMVEWNHRSNYIGTAGEYAVCSELIMQWYQANVAPVDIWVDVVAYTTGNNIRYIQVKSSATLRQNGQWFSFVFTIGNQALLNNANINMFYVFVTRYMQNNQIRRDYFILSQHEINHLVNQQIIRLWANNRYVITIQYRLTWEIVLNQDHNIENQLNNRSTLMLD